MDVFISTLCFLLKEIPTKSRRDTKGLVSEPGSFFVKKFTHLHHKKYHLNKKRLYLQIIADIIISK
mgnify:CR=1 FL=1